jgi:dTDP-4-dehydrorhamnose reductase
MRVLITGREGQVVRALLERGKAASDLTLIAVGRPELDLAQPGSAAAVVKRIGPDVVINAAAYTAVDQAEDEPHLADRVNGEAAGELAEAARETGAAIIQLSTDYVFDGRKNGPYNEDDPVCPIGAYGRSKLLGEERVRAATPDHLIVRTAWVYSPWGKNFVKTMMGLASNRNEVNVVADQRGSPTSALDIADGLLAVLAGLSGHNPLGLSRILHLTGSGSTTWFGFAGHVFEESARLGLPQAKAKPITTAEFPTKATRPANSVLDTSRFTDLFGYNPPKWERSVSDTVRRLAA